MGLAAHSIPIDAINEYAGRSMRAEPDAPYPEANLIDRSATLEAPAGKRGFVTVRKGHFVFADGKRARFFGINLAKNAVFIDKPEIERLAALFARSGINLVRIHHIDDTQGILSTKPEEYFNTDRLDKVDYWIAELRKRGIYVCLDLNDYRTFRTEENVPSGELLGRGAKPYAVFDRQLINLQKDYAKRFLVEHINPYTHMSYAQDPAIAMLELYDENGLFIRRGEWSTLREPYQTVLRQRWNDWLMLRYGGTASLRDAWTDHGGASALQAGETLEAGTVQLPNMAVAPDIPMRVAPTRAPARVSDGAQFAYDMQVAYLRDMQAFLRQHGVRVPITAVGAQDVLPDQMATAASTDYIGINFYWDHPTFSPGQDWALPSYHNLKNPLLDNQLYSFPVTVSLARMARKPLVVRELSYCYPNPFRGAGMIEAAAYGAYLDLDALILFTYDTDPLKDGIGYFNLRLDPLRWTLVPQAARLFRGEVVRPAERSVGIGYSQIDAFTWYDYLSPLYQMAFSARVENYFEPHVQHPYSVLFTAGRSCGGRWMGNRIIAFANHQHTDLLYRSRVAGPEVPLGYTIRLGGSGTRDLTFNSGFGYDAGITRSYSVESGFAADDLIAQNLVPIATAENLSLGFLDPLRRLIVFHTLSPELGVRVGLDALRAWSGAPVSHADRDRNMWRADTGQLERDGLARLLRVNTPRVQALAGRLDSARSLYAGDLRLETTTPIGTLTGESLDDKPLRDSTSMLLTMTSRASNTQTGLTPTVDRQGNRVHQLTALGTGPIHTHGECVTKPTTVTIGDKPVISLALRDGTWQYLLDGHRALLYCDTGDIAVTLPAPPKSVRAALEEGGKPVPVNGTTFMYPVGARYVEIAW